MRTPLFAALAALVASAPQSSDPVLDFTGPARSAEPFVASNGRGGLLVSWIEPVDSTRWALRIAERDGGRWRAPVTVSVRDNFFVNWADFPVVSAGPNGHWTVHWLEKTATKSYAYHIRTSVSTDRGATWSAPATLHSDRSATEHGFVAMAARPGGGVDVVWLDARETADTAAHGAMALAAGFIDASGQIGPDVILDRRTCDCCQTALARTSEGLIAAYRDRNEDEVRDISVVRQVSGRWTAPTRVAEDGWVYRACPVNGPAIATFGKRVAVAWFTGASGTPRVKLAWSSDAGAGFGPPIAVDDGNPLGRTDVELLADGSALVSWLEIVGEKAEWRLKRIAPEGGTTGRWTIGSAPRTRQAGFARTALLNGEVFIAWTAPGDQGGIRVHRVGGDFRSDP